MKKVTVSEMQALDQAAIRDYGISSLILMENAGRAIADVICRLHRQGRITVFAGQGNNGGDGFVAARHLHNRGFEVKILLLGDIDKLKPDAKQNFEIARRMQIAIERVTDETHVSDLLAPVKQSDWVVDALFGVGLKRDLAGRYARAVDAINSTTRDILAVDVPSGLNADTGEVLGTAVKATITATLALPKKGLFELEGPRHAGKICVVDIGIPRRLLRDS